MSSFLKVLAGVVAVAFIALVAWVVNTLPEPPDEVDVPQHKMTYDNNIITETKDGKVVWELKADYLEVVAETKQVTMIKVQGKYYTDDNRVLDLVGDTALFDEASGDIQLKGNVKSTSSDGYEMSCNVMNWAAGESKMVLTGDVVIKNNVENLLAKGDVAEATDGFNKLKLSGKAHISKNMMDVETVQ